MALQIIRDLWLQVPARLRPFFQKKVQLFEFNKQMRRFAKIRCSATERASRIDELRRTVMMAAAAAIVAWLVGRTAFGTLAAHEPVWKKGSDFRVVQLLDISLFY